MRLIVVVLLACPLFAGYGFRRSITVNSAQITGTLTNFPMSFGGTYAYLATVANSGDVQNANGYDIIFTSDSAGTMPLACEQESYSATTGAVQYWVDVPSIAVGTVIYIFYGNSGISTAQCGVTGTWDTNTSMVLHAGTVSGLVTDSTGNNTVTNHATTATGTGCVFDGCAAFASSGPQYLTAPNTSSLELGTTLTLEVHPLTTLTPSCSGGNCNQVWFDKRNLSGSGNGYFLAYNCVNAPSCSINYIEFYLKGTLTSSDTYWNLGTINVQQSILATYDGATMSVYLGGALATLESGTTFIVVGSTDDAMAALDIGTVQGGGAYMNGTGDEFRISNVSRSAAWIAAEANNTITSSFVTIGSAVSSGAQKSKLIGFQ